MTTYNRVRIGEQEFAWSTNVGSGTVRVQIRDGGANDLASSGTWIGGWDARRDSAAQWQISDRETFREFDLQGYRQEMEVLLSVIRGTWRWRRDEAQRRAKTPLPQKFQAGTHAISVSAYGAACEYPGKIDERSAEQNLQAYCAALGIQRAVRQLRRGWSFAQEPALARHVDRILEVSPGIDPPRYYRGDAQRRRAANAAARAAESAIAAANSPHALAARASEQAVLAGYSRDSGDALAAIEARQSAARTHSFPDIAGAVSRATLTSGIANEIVTRCWASPTCPGQDRHWWFFDLSHLALTAIGAQELGLPQVSAWADPLFHAFQAGCWQLIWIEEVLYWVAKPRVRVDEAGRLHCETGPALDSHTESEPHYYWHGVRVPDGWLLGAPPSPLEALNWPNTEQRRAACEIIGWQRILDLLRARTIDADPDPQIGTLVEVDLSAEAGGDGRMGRARFLRVLCGTGRKFALPVPPDVDTAGAAQAWLWDEPEALVRAYRIRT